MREINFTPLLLVVALGACAPASSESPELAALDESWEAALNAGDVDALVALYTDDARLLPPNVERGQGREAIAAAFGEMVSAGLTGELETIEARVAGDIGYTVGTYSLKGPDGAEVDRGKYMATWRPVGGEWRMSNDTWNSDMPAPFSGTTLMITHEVEDPARWLAAWRGADSRHKMFAQNGAPHVRTYQSASNPRLTGLLIDVADMGALETMLNSPEGAAAKRQDGVRDPTMRVFMEVK